MAKKKFNSNKVETDYTQKQIDPEWKKMKKPIPFVNEVKAELKAATDEISKDATSHDKEVASDERIKNICKKKGVIICKQCGGVNCNLWKKLCKNQNKPITFPGGCKGVPAKYSDLSKFAKEYKPKFTGNKKGPNTNTSHSPASVIPQSASTNVDSGGYDSWDEADRSTQSVFGMRLNQVGMTAGANNSEDDSDEEDLFDCECDDIWDHGFKQEFFCKICKKSETFNFNDLAEHWL